MKLETAMQIASETIELLRPCAERIEIGGSIRRKVPEVKDIEIVMIRRPNMLIQLKEIVDGKMRKRKGEVYGKYCQRWLSAGPSLDLFFANKDNWGNIFLIRTGSWEFSKRIMGTEAKKAGYVQKDGYLWKGEEMIPCFEEQDFFDKIGMEFVKPELRFK